MAFSFEHLAPTVTGSCIGLYGNFAKFVAKVPLGARGAQFRESLSMPLPLSCSSCLMGAQATAAAATTVAASCRR